MAEVFLLISDHPEDPSFLAEVASINGATVQAIPDLKQAMDYLSKHPCGAIFLDLNPEGAIQKFEAAVQAQFGIFNDKVKPAMVHLLSDRALDESRDNIQSPFFSNFCQRPTQDHSESAQFYGRYLKAAQAAGGRDLEAFLGPGGDVQEVLLSHSDQKQEAAEEVRQYLIQGKIPSRISNIIANSVDELLMNAIFDAPVDEFGKHIYTSTARSQSRQLEKRELTRMKIGFDGFYAGITVVDQWGSLDRGRLLNHVSINYRDSDYTVKQGQAGAGLGLATIFQGGATLIYNCTPGKETSVTLIYRTYDNYRAFKGQFHFFSAKFNG